MLLRATDVMEHVGYKKLNMLVDIKHKHKTAALSFLLPGYKKI